MEINYFKSTREMKRRIFVKYFLFSFGLLLTCGELKSANTLIPSLLIDASLTNTSPSASEQFCYKIRYRCNSTTEHCTDSYIEMTLPDGMVIGALPPMGGNILNITQTVGTPSGTYLKIDLESPASLGLPAGTLAAGSSGLFEICLVWECLPEGDTQDPIDGSLINFISQPTLYASGNSTTANSTPDVLVPIFNNCDPGYSTSGGYRKTSPSVSSNVNPGGIADYVAQIPAHNGPLTFTEMFDSNFALKNAELPDTSWVLEILCDTTWYTIPNIYQDLNDWIADNASAGTLSNLEINGVQTGCKADTTAATATSGGFGYATDISGCRITTDSINAFTYTSFTFEVKETVPFGTTISNCFVFSDTAVGTICGIPFTVVDGVTLSHYKSVRSGIGDLTLPSYPSGLPSKQADDILWEVRFGAPSTNGDPVSGFIIRDTLPLGLTYDTDPIDGNWSYVFLPGNHTVPAPYDMADQPACLNPIFTKSVASDGRIVLEWDFQSCTSYPRFDFHSRPQIFYTTRFDRTVPLPTSFTNEAYFSASGESQIWCGSDESQMYSDCMNDAVSAVPASGGAIYGSKSVNGLLDNSYSSFPNNGTTDTSGVGVYEILIEVADLEGIKKMDIVDILPHIGDSTLTPRVVRGSEWSGEIAGAMTIEKFDIVAQAWVDASTDITSELFATTYNPCYMDATLQVRAQTGLTEPAVAGCSSTDFDTSNPLIGAKAFALTWENDTDPLLFGEVLRIQIPIQQLAGEANPGNNKISWNSFAVTGTQPDDDELFTSEPLKVGLQMLTVDNVTIGDKVWNDTNANGIQDPNETGIFGVTVSLLDAAGNPIISGGEPVQVITDQSGNYLFSGLDPNTTYQVRLDKLSDFGFGGVLSNMNLTLPNIGGDDDFDSDATLVANYPTIIVTTGAIGTTDISNDFGYYQGATICGYAWEDDDASGSQDILENPMDSIQIQLVNSGGAIVGTTMTNSLGEYSFPNITPGTYTLQITNLGAGGHIFTTPNTATNDDLDSDVITGDMIGPIVLTGRDFSCNHDVGLIVPVPNPAAIIGTVWDELINDGIQDANETGVAGIQVNLLDDAQFVIATTYTDANGDYEFLNLIPNQDYYVNVVPGIANPITSPQDAGADDTVDSDVDPISGTTAVINPAPDETIDHVDAGIIFPYSLGNQVWIDANNNGIFDVSEGVVPGAEIYLYDVTNAIYLDTTITDVNGKFVFINLQPGDYLLELLLPTDLISANDISSSANPNDVDNDDNGIGILNATHVKTSVISIVAGGGNVGDPNWIESDHGQAIDGAFDLTSNPKAYYTLDFGLQYKQDCSVPMVQYAITDGAISKAGQTTDYFYEDVVQNLKTYVNHVPRTKQDGVIRCFDYCDFGNWMYYFNPMDPDEYLFAIEHGNNVTPIEYIELRVDDIPSDRYSVTADDATYVMARDWFVRTVNDAPLLDAAGNPTTVNIRFYFPEEEFKEIMDAAIAQATTWGGYTPTVADAYWFKRDAFDPDLDIDATGSLLAPSDITSLRNSPTSSLGINTSDGIAGQTGNGKNHIQFNGINSFSGGTAAITINKTALPVAISSFEAEDNGCNALLQWSVESEVDFSHYIIERSRNGVDFEYVQQIIPLKLDGTMGYSYTDENINGKMFYRLKLLNLDGTYKYTDVILVDTICEDPISNLNLYPNPLGLDKTNLTVSFLNKTESVVWIIVSNLAGSELMKFPYDAMIGDNTVGIDISNLNVGTYFITLQKSKGKLLTKQFLRVTE